VSTDLAQPRSDQRRRRYVPVDIHIAFGPFGTKLLDRFGMEGLCAWMLLLAAAKREPVQGTFTYTSESEAWVKLGAQPSSFDWETFLTFCGRNKQTRKRRSGRVTHVEMTGWQQWNDEHARELANAQKSRKRREKTPDNARTSPGHSPDNPSTEYEYEYEGEVTPLAAAAAAAQPRTRPRDLLWEAVLDVCGVDPAALTSAFRGGANRAVKELRDAGATPEQVRDRAAEYRRRFDTAALTPTALAKHWPTLAAPAHLREPKRYGRGLTASEAFRQAAAARTGEASPPELERRAG